MPRFQPAELGFIRAVSWLYAFYNEADKVTVDFLAERLPAYGLDPDGSLRAHPPVVTHLRTYLQHNLDPSKGPDKGTQAKCEDWFKEHCETARPGKEKHWLACVLRLLEECIRFLEGLRECLWCIEKDESCRAICQDWHQRRSRHHTPDEYERLIAIVAADMGRDAIDASRLCRRYFETWNKELQLCHGNYDFETEARKLIEHTLLHDVAVVLPVTGEDIMQHFGVEPGPVVGQLLARADAIYTEKPLGRDELLAQLAEEMRPG